jgi:hypothetical protein
MECLWDLDDDPNGNVQHIAEHGLAPEDVEHALQNCSPAETSRSSGLPLIFGFALDGRLIVVVYEPIDDRTIYPVTAYEPMDS